MHNFFFHAQIRHMSMAKHLYKWQSECQYLLTHLLSWDSITILQFRNMYAGYKEKHSFWATVCFQSLLIKILCHSPWEHLRLAALIHDLFY